MEVHPCERLFVTKIPPSVGKDEIQAYFARFGYVTDCYLPNAQGGGHKGICFISFADGNSGSLAIQSAPHVIGGYEVVVDVAIARERGGEWAGGGQPHSAHSTHGAHSTHSAAHGGQQGGAAANFADSSYAAGYAAGYAAAQAAMGVGTKGYSSSPPHINGNPNGPTGGHGQSEEPRIFVTKISSSLTRENLQDYFSQFGDVSDVYLPIKPGLNTHKGICFISFRDRSAVELVLAQPAHEVLGSPIVVDLAVARNQGVAPGASGIRLPQQVYAPVLPAGKPTSRWEGDLQRSGGAHGLSGNPLPGRLFVTRVPTEISRMDLLTYFQQFGLVTDCFVPNGGKGIAFVSFVDPGVAAEVLARRQHNVRDNAIVNVEQAYDRPQGFKEKGTAKGCCKGTYSPY